MLNCSTSGRFLHFPVFFRRKLMLAGTILPIGSRCQKSAHNLVTGNLHKTDSALCKLFTVSTFSTAKQNPLSVQVSL